MPIMLGLFRLRKIFNYLLTVFIFFIMIYELKNVLLRYSRKVLFLCCICCLLMKSYQRI